MTKELLNELMNALVDGTLFGICFSFWIMIFVAVWRWLHIPLERNSQSATAERLSAPNGKFVVS